MFLGRGCGHGMWVAWMGWMEQGVDVDEGGGRIRYGVRMGGGLVLLGRGTARSNKMSF